MMTLRNVLEPRMQGTYFWAQSKFNPFPDVGNDTKPCDEAFPGKMLVHHQVR